MCGSTRFHTGHSENDSVILSQKSFHCVCYHTQRLSLSPAKNSCFKIPRVRFRLIPSTPFSRKTKKVLQNVAGVRLALLLQFSTWLDPTVTGPALPLALIKQEALRIRSNLFFSEFGTYDVHSLHLTSAPNNNHDSLCRSFSPFPP